ncbi:hypothetical protein QQS21_003964 [Conoideocrella luteorostrata]|uniref:RSC complex subunit Rsc7 n=1 Tax=Conoideocrella luteorostrata TaxID=1105319 RepID=A0AAJ0CT97_9HYPO|nr:hypothetical protein QQS21_003964 [Conoideocrella luteorostrata]
MEAGQPNSADSATINPAALSSPALSNAPLRGLKRNRPSDSHSMLRAGNDVTSPSQPKRARPMKPSDTPGQPPASGATQTAAPPQTPQSQSSALPSQTTPAYGASQTAAPPKTTPTKSTVKALPTVRDHTTDQLNQAGDEYLPREIDEFGEKKVMANGQLLGNRTYRCRTFLVPNRGDKLFMLATECARVLGYRDSYLLFNKNRSLYKIIASQTEKDDLVQQEILPFSYRSRQIAIVTARSMFRQFGSRVIENGRRVRDDYWETKARKQGFTEADPAGEKRPGAAKAREAAEAQNNLLMSGPHTEIVYNNTPGPYPGAAPTHLVQAGMMGAPPGNIAGMPRLTVGAELSGDTRPRDFSGIIKGGPRQEISGPAYQDQTRPSPLGEIHSQAHHAADFNRSVNQQRDMRGDYLHGIWRRPHEQPASSGLNPTGGPADTTAATSRPSSSPHTAAAGVAHQPVVSSQSPQMMMTAAPYSQSIHAQNSLGSAGSGSMSQGAPGGYSYQPNQAMWSQNAQPPHHNYGSYTTQSQAPHPSQSPASHLRQPSAGQLQPNMPFPGMGSMQYSASQGMYPADQTPRQYMPQSSPGGPQVSQAWSGQHSPPPPQWWTQPQQPQ